MLARGAARLLRTAPAATKQQQQQCIRPHHHRKAFQVMAYQTRTDSMMQTAKQYMMAWQPELACGPKEQLVDHLQQIVAPGGVMFQADGVVHLEDRVKNAEELATHIQERHRAYKHVLHDAFCMATDEKNSTVFIAVRFAMQSVGPVAGQEPSGWPSQGILLERLVMDERDRITQALVCRQLTREEAGALTVDPTALNMPPLDDTLLYAPEEKLSAEDINAMRSAVERWVHCWGTGACLTDIEQVLAPDVQQLSGYGLGKRSVPFSGVQGAFKMVEDALSHMDNVNNVLSTAVCTDRRAGFVHWQANMMPPGVDKPQVMQGLDYLRFSPDNKISLIWSFTMRPYSNIREDAPRGAGVD